MAKINFDVKYRPQIESGEYKVETELGNPALVMDWDWNYNGEKCLAVKIPGNGKDVGLLYDYKGKRVSIFPPEEGSGLVLVTPEPELTEFEKAVKDLCWKVGMGEVVHKDDIIKKTASKLLDLARNQLQIEGLVTMGHLNKACETEYQSGLADGKNEALNDLPMWKKADKDMHLIRKCLVNWDGEIDTSNFIPKDSYYIPIIELEHLLKEDYQ